MQFDSLDYILFFVTVVATYWLVARVHLLRLLLIVAASCLFYVAWNPHYLLLILASTLIDFSAGLLIAGAESPRSRKAWLTVSVVGNLGLLGTFKYFNFFSTAVTDVLALFDVGFQPTHLDVLLPVGISFFTFQSLSYTIDVYRGQIQPTRNPLVFACFVTFFPQLVAGPIVRAAQLIPQLCRRPRLDHRMVSDGAFLIATGFLKKVAIGDFLAVNLVDPVFADPIAYSSVEVLLALYGFTVQIYFDFSGYTDVARGSAMLMGLKLPENFNRPYAATNPADFWRRWHMTLTSWLRDYLYFPLGGSRVGPARAYWNLGLTMFLVGLWHGAAWTFVIYAVLQAAALVGHRCWKRRFSSSTDASNGWPVHLLKIVATFHFVVLSRIFFRASSLQNAGEVGEQLLAGLWGIDHLAVAVWAVVGLALAAHFTPRRWFTDIQVSFGRLPAPAQGTVLAGVGVVLTLTASLHNVPYIYFQF